MNCLCCGKPLNHPSESGWHRNCIKHFFGTSVLPEIDITASNLEIIASETVRKGLTVPGVQKKISLHLFSEGKQPRLTLVDYPTGYILKPQVDEYRFMPESEHLVMSMADACRIITVPHALIQNGDTVAYITKRVDRIMQREHVFRLAMEDFCQLDLRLAQDKYHGSYERCSKVINRYSSRPQMDQTELFLRLVFCFMTGNSDMHLKNFSLIETAEGSREYIISPAYDLLPVNLIMPQDTEEFALPMNGKKTNLRKKDFLIFAKSCGIPGEAAQKMITFLLSKKAILLSLCAESLLPEDMKANFADLIESRCKRLAD